jgi:hypothetical protein
MPQGVGKIEKEMRGFVVFGIDRKPCYAMLLFLQQLRPRERKRSFAKSCAGSDDRKLLFRHLDRKLA